MNIRRVRAVARKETLHILRDPRSMVLALVQPMIMLLLFGFALTLDIDRVPMAVWNQDGSQTARNFLLNFKNSRYFRIIGYFDNYPQLVKAIDTNKALMCLVIPRDFSQQLAAGKTASVQLLADGSDANTATIALGYVEGVAAQYNISMLARMLGKKSGQEAIPIDVRPRIWFNEELKSRNFIIPGLIAVIMMIIAALLISQAVAKEWEQGTMEQLIATPVRAAELILGKFMPYFMLGVIDILLVVAMGEFVFHVPMRGNFIALFALSCLFLTGALAMGLFISITAKNQLLATQIAILATFLPTFLLSGFIYPISNMPVAIQLITYFVPARYYITILKGIYLKGVPVHILLPQILYLTIFTAVMVVLAKKNFKKSVA